MFYLQEKNNSLLASYIQKLRNSRFRQIIWPIKSVELIKFVPMAILMFMILLNQNIVRAMKDSLVMTRVGPEVISFIKLWGEMPAGILFVILYAKLCNIMTTERAFRYIVLFFLGFFLTFVYVLFPYTEIFHPAPSTVEYYSTLFPHFKWFIIIWGNWSFILFYIMGELWPIIVFSLLYWQLANKITKTEEAGRFYSFFSLFGQSNLLISGSIIVYFSSGKHFLVQFFAENLNKSEVAFKSFLLIILASGVITLLLHKYIENNIVMNPKYFSPKNKEKTLVLTVPESIKMILSSKYLGLICVMIVSYGMTINLIEGVWFAKAKELFPRLEDFMAYQGSVLFWTGAFTLICSFLGSTVIRAFGWYWGAVLTPLAIFIAGGLFFAALILEHFMAAFTIFFALKPLVLIVFIGTLQNVLGKGIKYSLFDTTKEMSYIPLDDEMKTKGKAAVEVVGSKIGKSLGAFIQFTAFTIFPQATYDNISWFLAIIFVFICIVWISSVRVLDEEYQNLLKTAHDSENNIY